MCALLLFCSLVMNLFSRLHIFITTVYLVHLMVILIWRFLTGVYCQTEVTANAIFKDTVGVFYGNPWQIRQT